MDDSFCNLPSRCLTPPHDSVSNTSADRGSDAYLGKHSRRGILLSARARAGSVSSQWALTFSLGAACCYTGLWRSSEWLFVERDVRREREMFRLNGSVSQG